MYSGHGPGLWHSAQAICLKLGRDRAMNPLLAEKMIAALQLSDESGTDRHLVNTPYLVYCLFSRLKHQRRVS
jgi:hypothetical protein